MDTLYMRNFSFPVSRLGWVDGNIYIQSLSTYMGHQSMEVTEMSLERSHMCSYAICLTSTAQMMDCLVESSYF